MLYYIGELVENDPTVMKKIKGVGILQAGRRHQLLIMSCISKDVFYLKCGHIYELPGELKDIKKLQYIFASYWKAREIVRYSVRLLEEFLQQNSEQNQKAMNILSPSFL
ncbi:hypothetical protein ACMFMG_006252 [Clarireedia jacksonii]